MKAVVPPPPDRVARVRALAERALSPDAFRAELAVPLGEAEIEETLALIRWFRRRYRTPVERLAYVRRSYRRWMLSEASGGARRS